LHRCHELGRLIRETALASDLRVAVIGTGGLSHSPGAPESGRIDSEFDRDFLAMIGSNEPTRILDIPNSRMDAAGFGAWEIRQWATALGAAADAPARVLSYEPMTAWETGCAAAIFNT
jgi:protocatechuate 4,5-dioxygenase beta chain/2,3-dihydroxyphenylpropionate 1,2-dioxygenase